MEDNIVENIERTLFTDTADVCKNRSLKTDFYLSKVWLQCENDSCLKWRLLTKSDATKFDLSKPWYCHLSTDPWYNDCSVPEESFPEESKFYENGFKFVYSHFTSGSLVMVKLNGWPRWPAIICSDPVNEQVTYFNYYQVEFLGKPHTCGLISLETISPYLGKVKQKNGTKAKTWYKSALEEAEKLFSLSCEQRIQMCHVTQANAEKFKKPQRKYVRKKAVTEDNAKKRKLQSFHLNQEESFSQGDAVMSEAENILLDLGKVLQKVAEPFSTAKNLHGEKVINQSNKRVEDHQNDDDFIIIDGVEFKSGESIEEIAENLKQIDCLMSTFPSLM